MKRARIDWIVAAIAVLFAFGCGGGGCGGCAGIEPLPMTGFPANERISNAGQIRVTSSAITKIEEDPAGLLSGVLGSASAPGVITLDAAGGRLVIDLNKVGNEAARLEINPQQGSSTAEIVIRARVKTAPGMPIEASGCEITLDSTQGSNPSLTIRVPVNFQQDGTALTTRLVTDPQIENLENADYDVGGAFFCGISVIIPTSVLVGLIESQVQDQINAQFCKGCTTLADCGSQYATSCNADMQCQKANGDCLQELGIAGRLRGSTLFASLSPGTTGALDLYEVAGGYATTDNGGIALGLKGNMLPAGAPRDRCGPPGVQPAKPTIPLSTYFSGNTRPDTGAPYMVGFGLHKSQLDALAYAGYDGGLFCLTVGSSTVAQLSTDTISLLSRSLGNLVETNSAMAVGLRPQSPPTFTLGANTFKDDGTGNMIPDVPLLDINFTALEIDFFAQIDEQYVRVFTVVSDVNLDIGMQTTAMGELAPVIGNADNAFTNLSVKNSEAITESPAEIAGLFPTLLALVVPQLSGALSPIALPAIGPLQLNVTAVTAVDNNNFLAIYADLETATMPRIVDTKGELSEVLEVGPAVARDPAQWRTATPPAVRLNLDMNDQGLEFSWRLNGGSWSGWNAKRHPLVSSRVFFMPGVHKLEIRAREIGRPETIDREPIVMELLMGTDVPLASETKVLAKSSFHGQAGASGCSCETSSPTSGIVMVLVIGGLVLVPRRRKRSKARRLGLFVWLAALMSLPGCSCGSNPCGDVECLDGEIAHGGGRWTSIAGDQDRVMVATYDNFNGDLMVVDATDPNDLKYRAVDGLPEGVTPTYDPDGYRGGVEDEGPNVGAWTSIAMTGGLARVAYQDRDANQLKYAVETKTGGSWESHVVDGAGEKAGMYASMVIDGDGRPAIAHLAIGVDDGMGHRNTELRLMRAANGSPTDSAAWTKTVLATAPAFCGGLCGSGTVCTAGAAETDPQSCVAPTTDCTATCGDGETCVMGTCRTRFDEPKVVSLPGGTGLYVSLVALPDGRLAAAFYDMTRRALVLAVEGTRGGNDFSEIVLDGNAVGRDRGMWASAIADAAGVVHVAYQDALGDQVFYTTWNAGTVSAPEVVDTGERTGDRTHIVGAGLAIYLDNGGPVVAYQDGLVSDVVLASRGSGTWTTTPLAAGPLLDGFSVAATTGHGAPALAWGTLDPALTVPWMVTVGGP